MLVLSHRGNCANFPENTLDAFRAAAKLGVDGIETDVRLSADGLPVLCHDRVTPDGREVASLTRHELAEALGHHVPTLDEALDLWDGGLWNLEIKTLGAGEVALDVLKGYRESRDLFITSFRHDFIRNVARTGVYRCGALLASYPAGPAALDSLLAGMPGVNDVVWDYEIFDRALSDWLKARGVRSMVYGVETEREHADCRLLGLAGVITNRPDFLLEESASC
ncbi:MAG: glycerophosphodiester phosphodiesterase [Thermoanaerobaculia bacterium]